MTHADVALFTGLGYFFTGMAQILRAEMQDNESDGFKEASAPVGQALQQVQTCRQHEERILEVAQSIDDSAYFVRRTEVISQSTQALSEGLAAMARDLAEGFYPAEACSMINPVLTRMVANFEQDAKIEGVLSRFAVQS